MSNSNQARLPDYHTHHALCMHASGRTIDYAAAASARGVMEFAATDHCPTDCGFGKEHRMTLEQFPQYLEDVDEARSSFPGLAILLGVEADYYPGGETFLDAFLCRHPFDLVLGSVHFRDYWSTDPSLRGLSNGGHPIQVWREYFALIGRLADSGLYDIVTHLDLPKRFGNGISVKDLEACALPALDRIAEAGMAIEINTSGLTHSVRECYPSASILRHAAERGIGLVFGSDAHSPERVGDGFDLALRMAREAGFREARRYRQRTWTTYAI